MHAVEFGLRSQKRTYVLLYKTRDTNGKPWEQKC